MEKIKEVTREFKLTSLALKNKNTVFLIIGVILVFGTLTYRILPKELFPDVVWPVILVQTPYFGNPPEDIENLISRPLEKELKSLKGLKKLSSSSAQDASMIFVEFNTNIVLEDALQEVKDAVDKAKNDLPTDLDMDPIVMDIDLSEFPILTLNLSGDFSIEELKEFAEYYQDEIETIYEVSKVNIKGLNEREIQVNLDPHKMDLFQLGFRDIEGAIANENISMSGGEVKMGETRRSLRVIGEFTKVEQIEDIIVKHEDNRIIYMRDVAEVVDGYADPKSYARLDNQPVVSVEVVKKGGENLLNAIDQTRKILKEAKETGAIPENLKISITNDQSEMIRSQLDNLWNSIIMGMIFVIGVLFFFLGLRNALFVGMSIPLSMFLSFVILGAIGAKINMIVLFSLILALGMLVDNAIVAVENIYRFVDQGKSLSYAVKHAVGEIAMPIISSTATTLAAFFPLLFWNDTMGEFMKFLPITLIIVLSSSLFSALVLLPVLSQTFINPDKDQMPPVKSKALKISLGLIVAAVLFYVTKVFFVANLLMIAALLILANLFFLYKASQWFQNKFLVKLEQWYLAIIRWSLAGSKPWVLFAGTFLLLIGTIFFMGAREPKVVFFPDNEPKFIYVIAEFPIGTDIEATNKKIKPIEDRINEILLPYKDIVESINTTVGEGVQRQNHFSSGSSTPNKAMVSIKFVDFQNRMGFATSSIMKEMSEALLNHYPGIKFSIEKDANGPQKGFPINIEITGPDIDHLVALADTFQLMIEESGVRGIEGLSLDMTIGKPEILVNIDRDKARRLGLSTAQIAMTIRTALFGSEASKFKEDEDDYPIQVRLQEKYRNNLPALMNQRITFRNHKGRLMQIPISSVANISYSTSYGTIRRLEMERVVTLFSGVIEGYNATEINQKLKKVVANYEMPQGYEISFTGEQEEQQKTMDFMIRAFSIAIAIMIIILVSQFNSVVKPFIIMASVLFSTIGVFGGYATFKMDFVIMMTGIGIISLAGVVVNNAIVLIDYIDFLKLNRKKELGMDEDDNLPVHEIVDCIVRGGNTRLRPVLLTAITTVLGLFPLAMGVNINFSTMLSDFDPQFFIGGDNAMFWGPMSWTVIYGLTFATFLTLVIVPVMYLIVNRWKLWFLCRQGKFDCNPTIEQQIEQL